MTASTIQEQQGNFRPPRAKFIIAQAVSATSQGYDLTKVQFEDETTGVFTTSIPNVLFLDLYADGGDVYFALDTAAAGTNTIDDTSASQNTAGTAWVQGNAGIFAGSGSTVKPCTVVAKGTRYRIRIDRQVDRTLIVKCASAGTAVLRIAQASQSLPGALGAGIG